MTNPSWLFSKWNRKLDKGTLYQSKSPIQNGHTLLCSLVSELRKLAENSQGGSEISNWRKQIQKKEDGEFCEKAMDDFISKHNNFLSSLRNERTDELERKFWGQEYSKSGLKNIWEALGREEIKNLKTEGAYEKLDKIQLVSLLVEHRIPLLFFPDMDGYVTCTVTRLEYLGNINEWALSFLTDFVISTKQACDAELSTYLKDRENRGFRDSNDEDFVSETSEEVTIIIVVVFTYY